MRYLLVLFLLSACGQKPDLSEGVVSVWWNGHQPIPVVQATDIVYRQGLLICPDPKKLADNWCAEVHILDSGFENCAGWTAPKGFNGCQTAVGYCEYLVGWKPMVSQTALVDEEAHFVWEYCFGSTGEDCWKIVDGGLDVCSQERYVKFVSNTRAILVDAGL
jgi:hypothetical protein